MEGRADGRMAKLEASIDGRMATLEEHLTEKMRDMQAVCFASFSEVLLGHPDWFISFNLTGG